MPSSRTPDAQPPSKGTKLPVLTKTEIVEAALRIIRVDGLEALSMRRLSRELGRSAMAPYWYVDDKQQLLELVADSMLAGVSIPPPDSGPWQERLRHVVDSIDSRLRDYPGIADLLLARMSSSDRRVMNEIMEILLSAGFVGSDVLKSYALLHTYLYGRYKVIGFAEPHTTDVTDLSTRIWFESDKPRGHDFFAFGVDTVIAGFEAKLEADQSR